MQTVTKPRSFNPKPQAQALIERATPCRHAHANAHAFPSFNPKPQAQALIERATLYRHAHANAHAFGLRLNEPKAQALIERATPCRHAHRGAHASGLRLNDAKADTPRGRAAYVGPHTCDGYGNRVARTCLSAEGLRLRLLRLQRLRTNLRSVPGSGLNEGLLVWVVDKKSRSGKQCAYRERRLIPVRQICKTDKIPLVYLDSSSCCVCHL